MTIRALARKVPAYLQIGLAHDFKKEWLHEDFYKKAADGKILKQEEDMRSVIKVIRCGFYTKFIRILYKSFVYRKDSFILQFNMGFV